MTTFHRVVMGIVLTGGVLAASSALADESQAVGGVTGTGTAFRVVGLAASAALTMALSVLGAAHAIGRIGSAALGAAAEKPELLTRSILFLALAEGLAVLGFVISIMMLQKI
jgi:V/A-type H+/Na+-transporting ATPase subunit K